MAIQLNNSIPQTLRNCVVTDSKGQEQTLGALCAERPTLMLFVRHFGCIGCSENISLMAPRFKELEALGVRVLIIGCGPSLFIDGFMERHHLLFSPVEVYSDDSLATHRAAGLMYSIWGGFSPRGLYEMARAFVAGNVSSGTEGDIKQQAGALLVDRDGVVRLYHRNESIGHHVNPSDIVDVALASWVAENPEVA